MNIGIMMIAIGVILMAIFGAIGNKFIQEARSESAKANKDEIIDNQNSNRDESRKELVKNQEEILDGQEKIKQDIGSITKDSEILDYQFNIGAHKTNKQLFVSFYINNKSSFPGTKPEIKFIMYGFKKNGEEFKFQQTPNLGSTVDKSFQVNQKLRLSKIPFVGMFSTSLNFKNNTTFYAQDRFSLSLISKPYDYILNSNYIIINATIRIKEGLKQSKFVLIDISENNRAKTLITVGENEIDKLINKYKEL